MHYKIPSFVVVGSLLVAPFGGLLHMLAADCLDCHGADVQSTCSSGGAFS